MRRLVLIAVLALAAERSVSAEPAKIILIRHGEKPADHDDPHLTAEGRAHAERWVGYFTNSPTRLPDVLLAPSPTKKHPSVRASETIEPLAKLRHLTIETPYPAEDYTKLAHDLVTEDRFKGKTVVVCWVHQYLPQFVAALGIDPQPKEWKGEDYESVYEVTFPEGKPVFKKSAFIK